jgi:glycine/sarcosine N-methyltransferase
MFYNLPTPSQITMQLLETPMYEILSSEYDRFVDWPSRLAIELPFIIDKLQKKEARHVLDAAAGTGMHTIALAQQGYQTAGADISRGMIEQARLNAQEAGIEVRFEITGFGELEHTFGAASFDALLCLGNSLPHLLSHDELDKTLADFAATLKPGGMLLIQNRNFDAVVANHARWMDPQSHTEDGAEWIFQRFYDFEPDGLLTFNMIILKRLGHGSWSQQVISSRLRPILKFELILSLSEAGFETLKLFGKMGGSAFNPDLSPNLVVLARKHP